MTRVKQQNNTVKADAMRVFREARQRIEVENPGLLIRMNIWAQKVASEQPSEVVPEVIDKQKNIETVMKLLALKPDSDFMHKSATALLDRIQN